jgi:rubrerythrin
VVNGIDAEAIGNSYRYDPQEVSIACLFPAYDGPASEEHTMPNLKGSKTHQNLKDAFAGESQANRRYLFFAKVADIEGYPEVAGNFKETADGETGHAHGHLDYLKSVGDPATGLPIGDTALNLKAAIAGETHEYTDMYPGMAKNAREEGFAEIADWFETLAKAEKSHAGRFQKMLDSIS